jgi:4-hydroxybenzoate polyprenyltransferase
VPGDPLCGALLASHGAWNWRILPAMAASLCAYCAGLIINDLADFREDVRERPSRPLPSASVSLRLAIWLAVLFLAAALGAAFCANRIVAIVAGLLLVNILWYNLKAKRNAAIAPVAMGLCRGLSVLVGAVAIAPFDPSAANSIWRGPAFIPACVILVYIAAVTAMARGETRDPRRPALIGALIRALLFIQAGFCVWAGGIGWGAALVLLALWPISRMVSSHFYAS